jgi:hypothetical protein
VQHAQFDLAVPAAEGHAAALADAQLAPDGFGNRDPALAADGGGILLAIRRVLPGKGRSTSAALQGWVGHE